MNFPKPYADIVQRFRVPGGFVLLGSFLYFSQPTAQSILYGLPISIIGLLIRIWAAGHLAKNDDLAQSGPYSYVRNPLYLGSLFLAGGLVYGSKSPIVFAIFTAAFLLIYLPVIQLEEEHLRKIFPSYASYAEKVPALIPNLRPQPSPKHFRPDLFRRNKEWKAILGYLFGLVWLILRLCLPHG